MLEEHGIVLGDYRFRLSPTVYPERDYCVQYDESDLQFVQRLCEEEGIHYHFQHGPDGHERHDTVEANSHTELKAEEHLTVTGERKVEVKPQDHLSVGIDQHIQLGTAQLTKAGREIHLKAGQKMVIEAGIELTLKAGGSFIKLDPGGVTLVGPQARLNAGGSPGRGSGIGIKPPVLPGMADSDKAGEVLEQVASHCVDKPQQAVCEECLLRAQGKAQALVAR